MARKDKTTGWRPGPGVLRREAELLQRRVSDGIRSARPRVPHSSNKGEQVGGSLGRAVRSRALLKTTPATVTIQWSKLGTPLRFFVRGSVRQRKRPVKLTIPRKRLEKAVEQDAFEFFREAEAREARGA